MATTVNAGEQQLRMSFPIVKVEETADGDLMVWGKATDASLDSDDQIVDQDWSAKALEDWLTTGANVRVQHSPFLYPAGKGIEVATSNDGHWVKSLVVEETAKRLVKAGVLQAYSVGISAPKVIKDLVAKNGRIVGGSLAEISLVDRPANASCGFKIVKSVAGAPVDAEELFGKLEEALAAAEKTAPVEVVKAAEHGDDALILWASARTEFLNRMPNSEDEPDAWAAWKSEKDLFYDGTDEARGTWLYKRDMDAGVGGGTDRDKIPAEDFAGPNRTYPIVTPKDVHDAASLVGHADNPEAVKRRIVSIANRKGSAFVAQLPDSWTKGVEPEVEKSGLKKCPKCGKEYHADSKQRTCENCGADLPVASDAAKTVEPDVKLAAGETVLSAEEVKALKPGSEVDPDGDGDDDEDEDETKTKAEMPYAVKRLHDFLCPVYSDETLFDEYASLKSFGDSVNVEAIRAYLGDEAATLAAELKAMDPEMVADARAQLHKAFMDSYPTVSVSPSNITPGSYRRSFLTSGRYRENASGTDSGARVPASDHTINADQFTRGALGGEQERQSPSNKSAPRGFAAASAAYAANVAQSLHDHITDHRGEVCAFAPTKNVMPDGMNATETLTPVTPPKAETPDLGKEYREQMSALIEKSGMMETEISTLRALVEELGAQPDPAQAPVRGVVAKSASTTEAVPVERTDVDRREPTEDDKLRAYVLTKVDSGDPNTRKMARETLESLERRALSS